MDNINKSVNEVAGYLGQQLYSIYQLDGNGNYSKVQSTPHDEKEIATRETEEPPVKEKKVTDTNDDQESSIKNDLKLLLSFKAGKASLNGGFLTNLIEAYNAQEMGLKSLTKHSVQNVYNLESIKKIKEQIKDKILILVPAYISKEKTEDILNSISKETDPQKQKELAEQNNCIFSDTTSQQNELKVDDLAKLDTLNTVFEDNMIDLKNKTLISICQVEGKTRTFIHEDPNLFVKELYNKDVNVIDSKMLVYTMDKEALDTIIKDKNKTKESLLNQIYDKGNLVFVKLEKEENLSISDKSILEQELKPEVKEVAQELKEVQTKFDVNLVNFNQLSDLGISKEMLERNGALDELLKGKRSQLLDFVHLGETFNYHFKGKLAMVHNEETGRVDFKAMGIEKSLEIPQRIGNTDLSVNDMEVLKQTNVLFKPISIGNNQFLLGVDTEIKRLTLVNIKDVAIDLNNPILAKLSFTEDELDLLKQGKIVKDTYYDPGKQELKKATTKVKQAYDNYNEIQKEITQTITTTQTIDKKGNVLNTKEKIENKTTKKKGRGL
jgi:hypothetical protein